MPGPPELVISFAERKLLRWLFLLYCLFILYGSFIPFHFSADPEFVRSQFARFITPAFHHGVRRFSLPDVVSNILLFMPFGFLWIGGDFFRRPQSRFWRIAFAGGVLGFSLGLMIESGQMFSPGRIPSILDALCNGLGSATGTAAGYLVFRAFRGGFGLIFLRLLRQRPSFLLLVLLLLAVVADAYYPFDVTLDISAVWHNLKNSPTDSLHRRVAPILVGPFCGESPSLCRHWLPGIAKPVRQQRSQPAARLGGLQCYRCAHRGR